MKSIRVRWLSRRTLFGLVLIAPAAALLAGMDDRVNPFGAILAAAMVAGAGIVLVHLVNRTDVTVDDGWLVVRHGPIPWPRGGRWRLQEVGSVTVRKHEYGKSAKSRSVHFSVDAEIAGKTATLVGGPLTEARAIEVRDAIDSWRQT